MTEWQSKAAFVIHVRERTDSSAGQLAGKVEHIATYRAARLRSLVELLAFLTGVLAEGRPRGEGRECRETL